MTDPPFINLDPFSKGYKGMC